MATALRDVLKVNLVFLNISLLQDPEELERFTTAVDTDVASVTPFLLNLQVGIQESAQSPQQNQILQLSKDRITLHLSPIQSAIEREYPEKTDLERLAYVASCAIEHRSGGEIPDAFGYNIEMVYEQDSPAASSQYLSQRLFKEKLSTPEGWDLKGGSAKLIFMDRDNRRWTAFLEPRFRDEDSHRLFLTLNLHVEESRIPAKEEIIYSLKEIWNKAIEFTNILDAQVS